MNFVVNRPQPIVHMTMRADLDFLLAREAENAGVQVVESCPVRQVNVQDEFVEIVSDKEKFRAKFVIAADGVHSATAKAAAGRNYPPSAAHWSTRFICRRRF